jgi:hypothetical protein
MKLIPFAFCCATVINAQWLHQPTQGVPRLTNGGPNWSAPAPKSSDGHPDLSGIWRVIPSPDGADLMQQLKVEDVQPWARELRQQRLDQFQGATTNCLPLGPLNNALMTTFGEGIKFIQTPGMVVMLYADLTYRQVFLDGRSLEKNPNPAWMGYSVGHWEGDTLVVESNGYNDRTWLDFVGLPHSEGLRVTERFRRASFGNMTLSMTLEDPAIYARPIHVDKTLQAMVDTEMLEYVCAENEKDGIHMTGKISAVPAPSSEELSKFAGTYLMPNPFGPGAIKTEVVLSGGRLMMDTPVGRLPLIPTAEATFSASGTVVRFVRESDGMAVISSTVEGDMKAVRKP